MQPTKIIYLYRITNTLNNKVYIGQTIDPNSRWRAHRKSSASDKPRQVIHQAIKKYGNDVFEFDVIAASLNQDDADWMEENLIQQYNSLAPTGYNIEAGGLKSPLMSQAIKDKLSKLGKQRYQTDPNLRVFLKSIRDDYSQFLKEQGLPLPIHTLEGKQKSMAAFKAARDGYQQHHGFDWSFGSAKRPEVRQKKSEAMCNLIQKLPQHWSKGRRLSTEQKAMCKNIQPMSSARKAILVEVGKTTRFKKGQAAHNKKLTQEIAEQIRIKHAQGISIRALSREYNINSKSISRMLKDKTNEF